MDEFVRRPKRPLVNIASPPVNRPQTSKVLRREIVQPVPKNAEAAPSPESPAESGGEGSKKNPKSPHFPFGKPRNKKEWAITIAAALLLLGGGFAGYWFILRDNTPPPVTNTQPEPEPEPEPAPTTEVSLISGRQIAIGDNAKPIYAVQIENSPEARPQSGLKDADIVNEAVAEGGITRFNAIFHDNVPANIGPIRSLRPYYIDWFLPYNAGIVHAGGSPEALSDVASLKIQDMDHGVNGSSFRRVSNRYAPHNLYSTGTQMVDLFTKKGYSNGTFSGLPRKEAAPAAAPTASTVNLKISSALYNVVFTYDKTSNRYLRAQGGSPHLDAESGQQLSPDVVIVPVMSKSIHPDRVHTKYGSVGSGKVYVFQDGTVTEGTWTKPGRQAQWQLTDSAGNPIALNPGQTWFTIVDTAGAVTYQP